MLRTRMRSLTPRTPGRSAQMPRTIRSISTPACEARYSAMDDVLVEQRIHLGDDARRASMPRMLGLALDQREAVFSARSSGATSSGS